MHPPKIELLLLTERAFQCEKKPVRPISVSAPENIDAVHDMVLSDQRIGLNYTVKTLDILRIYERVSIIVYVDLVMKNS